MVCLCSSANHQTDTLKLLSPAAPRQKGHIMSGGTKHVRQITSDHPAPYTRTFMVPSPFAPTKHRA